MRLIYMARRRSKWRRTTAIVKKMMQEAKKVKAYESLRQCPVCGNPHSLSIDLNEDKSSGRKDAFIKCAACGFEYSMRNLPPIADVFWVYSKILDNVHGTSYQSQAPSGYRLEEIEEEKEIEGEMDIEIDVEEQKE
jgi:transcription elongation factor Elf1